MATELKRDRPTTTTPPASEPRSVHAPEVPPLRRVTAEDVRKVEALLRRRGAL